MIAAASSTTTAPREYAAADTTPPEVLRIGGEQMEVSAVESGTAPDDAVSPDEANDRLVRWITEGCQE